MSDERDHGGPSRGRRRRRARTVGTSLLAACLAGLLVYLVLPGASGPGGRACGGGGAPALAQGPPQRLAPLREAVSGVLPQRVGRLYEEGTISSQTAWSDNEPAPPPVSQTAARPEGYEMRWWAPNGDDVVADAFVFSSPALAQRFFALASAPGCRRSAHAQPSERPPLSRDLYWVNPDGASETDVYLVRGATVYRVGDAPAGPQASSATARERAFVTVDTLACLLPDAQCLAGSRNVPA